MTEHRSEPGRPKRATYMAVSLIGLVLAWLVATKSLPSWLAAANPGAALAIDASQPLALMRLADPLLDGDRGTSGTATKTKGGTESGEASDEVGPCLAGSLSRLASEMMRAGSDASGPDKGKDRDTLAITGENRSAIRDLVARTLATDPLNARAIRILGQLALGDNDEAAAGRLMQAAARRSLRESVAVYWLMQKSHELGDPAQTLAYADALMRSRPGTTPFVAPYVAALAEADKSRGAVVALLARNPPWRPGLLNQYLGSVRDGRTPLRILVGLKPSPHPPTSAELRAYLDFLIGHKLYDLAYYAWLQFLPPEQLARAGFLFNGSFEEPFSGQPFDWLITKGSGFTADRMRRTDKSGEQALAIDFGQGRVGFQPMTQMTLLAPGAYTLTLQYKGHLVGRRGMIWRITCAASGQVLGESPMLLGPEPRWKEIVVPFSVPPAECRAQKVVLVHDARSASEQMVTGTILFDELTIGRASLAPGAADQRPPDSLSGKAAE